MAIDGHFWVDATVNGRDVKFLVDSGATMTTIDRETAQRAGVQVSPRARSVRPHRQRHHPRVAAAVRTRLEVGSIKRQDVGAAGRRQRRSQRARNEFPVFAEPLGSRGTMAGSGLLMLYGLYIMHIIILIDSKELCPQEAPRAA